MGLAANADSATEGEFLSLINSTRAANGLASLTVDGGLKAHARNHTQDMIDTGGIYHSTSSELRAAAGSGWSKAGENVGRGGTPSSLHSAFMNSPSHAKNVLGTYNYVGIGTGTSDGQLYVTVVFVQKGSATPNPTTTQPAPAVTASSGTAPPTAAPAKTTTTTLAPTTLLVGPDKRVTPGENCVEATRFGQICHD